jgi:hypothetical protein
MLVLLLRFAVPPKKKGTESCPPWILGNPERGENCHNDSKKTLRMLIVPMEEYYNTSITNINRFNIGINSISNTSTYDFLGESHKS